MKEPIRSTTILSVRRGDKVVVGGDGQVTLGNTVMKSNAKKVRRMHDGKVIAGFRGLGRRRHGAFRAARSQAT